MERGSRILVFLLLLGGLYFVFNGFSGGSDEYQPIADRELIVPEGERPPEELCDLWAERFHAKVSTRGGTMDSFTPLTAKYKKSGDAMQLVTAPDHPEISPLYTSLRNPTEQKLPAPELAQTDIQDFRIVESTAKRCVIEHESEQLRLTKTFEVGPTPYVVNLKVDIENVGEKERSYTLSVGTATFLLDEQVESQMFRMNPLMTHVECVGQDGEVKRMEVADFEPEEFDDKQLFPHNAINTGAWAQPSGVASLAAVSNAYFTNSFTHDGGPDVPVCLLQIEERWNSTKYSSKSDDPKSGAIYKARLAYPVRTLAPGAKEEFDYHAFIGPKERKALAAAGDRFEPLIDLGFFSVIAKVLVNFLLLVHDVVPSWGIAIVILTITARMLLFPLTWPSIKNMVHMRELKPEMDKLNEKYKDDAQAKGLAQMELWKKHGVNPMKGCLPQLASMPVWFALYTTLQTAVELYNIPFLWFPDLSEPDPYYVLPFIIGGVFFVQQKIMPMQAGDPTQQKMMMYFMPGMFTVFMLFLPAGLGVYMFTNSLLGIGQQQLVELHAKRTLAERKERMGDSEVVEQDAPKPKKRKKKR